MKIFFINIFFDKKIEYKITYNIINMEHISDENILILKECLDWDILTKFKINNNTLTITFIRKFKDYLNWLYITHSRLNSNTITNDFISEFSNYINWFFLTDYMILFNKLDIDFIRIYSKFTV